jgi:hypothetical protein
MILRTGKQPRNNNNVVAICSQSSNTPFPLTLICRKHQCLSHVQHPLTLDDGAPRHFTYSDPAEHCNIVCRAVQCKFPYEPCAFRLHVRIRTCFLDIVIHMGDRECAMGLLFHHFPSYALQTCSSMMIKHKDITSMPSILWIVDDNGVPMLLCVPFQAGHIITM